MEKWMIMAWISIATLVVTWLWLFKTNNKKKKNKLSLPPGPATVPVFGSIAWLRKSFSDLEPILRRLHSLHGPMVTLRIGPLPAIFVLDRSLARQALVLRGAAFASRPGPTPVARAVGSITINASPYGPRWRALRRNLTAEMLHPSRVPSFSRARSSALNLLLDRLSSSSVDGDPVIDHFRFTVFNLLAAMCFGDGLDERTIEDIESVQRRFILGFGRFNVLNFMPTLTKIVLRGRWRELKQLRADQHAVLGPLIESRINADKRGQGQGQGQPCYVDTLLELRVPVDDDDPDTTRELELSEMMSLVSEFLNGGTDTTSTSLQWIMANLVKHPEIQDRVYEEIREVCATDAGMVSEEDAGRLRYLKAVVLEGLRRHPPGHFVLPHAVAEDTELGGHLIPKKGTINFMVAEMGWDPAVWKDPMAFDPGRFLSGEDGGGGVYKGGEIKMMPFGAGRRVCPGSDLALLHLQYFVANLVWKFRWSPDPDHPVDLAEKLEFTVVMKHTLRARLSPRRTSP